MPRGLRTCLCLALASFAHLTPLAARSEPGPGPDQRAEVPSVDVVALIRREASANQVSPELAEALVGVLSGFDRSAQGPFGEVGLMQIRMATARMLGFKGSEAELRDPETNVRLGMAHLKRAFVLARGDICQTLLKYRTNYAETGLTPAVTTECRAVQARVASGPTPPIPSQPRPFQEAGRPDRVDANNVPQEPTSDSAARLPEAGTPGRATVSIGGTTEDRASRGEASSNFPAVQATLPPRRPAVASEARPMPATGAVPRRAATVTTGDKKAAPTSTRLPSAEALASRLVQPERLKQRVSAPTDPRKATGPLPPSRPAGSAVVSVRDSSAGREGNGSARREATGSPARGPRGARPPSWRPSPAISSEP